MNQIKSFGDFRRQWSVGCGNGRQVDLFAVLFYFVGIVVIQISGFAFFFFIGDITMLPSRGIVGQFFFQNVIFNIVTRGLPLSQSSRRCCYFWGRRLCLGLEGYQKHSCKEDVFHYLVSFASCCLFFLFSMNICISSSPTPPTIAMSAMLKAGQLQRL
ncbi:hypothetical protein D3C72_1661240 [compost metagenome]